MKVFDKIKDLFADEDEEEVVDTVKKEVIQVEIPAPKNPVIEKKEEVIPTVTKEEDASPFFDDTDFDEIKRSNPTLEEMYAKEEKKEVYKGRKEEGKKHFEPTPIISPVYGVLDKNYKKDDIVNKAEPPKENRNITLDEVRNKAYGTLEDELENTLFGRTSIMFQDNDKKAELKEIEKDLKETAAAIEMLNDEDEGTVVITEKPKHEKKEIEDNTEDLEDTMIATALEVAEEEKKEEKEDDTKLSENDLFDLIDDMYGKGE
nr:hypothetical protein [Bacilli bacterium]